MDVSREFEHVVSLIRREQRRLSLESIDSLWRVGDAIHRLRRMVARGHWGTTLAQCADRIGVHASSLADAARVASAFDRSQRDALRARLKQARVVLRPSHVVLLARMPVQLRMHGLEALLENAFSVRAFRAHLRRPIP